MYHLADPPGAHGGGVDLLSGFEDRKKPIGLIY